jgi:hypothetical protein
MRNLKITLFFFFLFLLLLTGTPQPASAGTLDGTWAGKLSCHHYTPETNNNQAAILEESEISFSVRLKIKGDQIVSQTGFPTFKGKAFSGKVSASNKIVNVISFHSEMGELALDGKFVNPENPTIHFEGEAADSRYCDFYLDLKNKRRALSKDAP